MILSSASNSLILQHESRERWEVVGREAGTGRESQKCSGVGPDPRVSPCYRRIHVVRREVPRQPSKQPDKMLLLTPHSISFCNQNEL